MMGGLFSGWGWIASKWDVFFGWFAAFGAAVQKLDGDNGQLETGLGCAILFGPDARTAGGRVGCQASFDEDLRAFPQVLIADFGLFVPGGAFEPVGLLDGFAAASSKLPVDGHRKVGDCLAGRRVAHVRVAPQVTDDGKVPKIHGVVSLWFCRLLAW